MNSFRKLPGLALIAAWCAAAVPVYAQSNDTIRIGVPTKAYWPTVVVRTAEERKFFEKEGVRAEVTIYRSGAEAFESLVAGAADLVTAPTALLSVARTRGVAASILGNATDQYAGWVLAVKADSPIKSVAQLADKKVGITSAGSGTDALALWAQDKYKVHFTTVPVGGGGLLPNVQSGNVDAAVLFPPASFQAAKAGRVRVVVDYGKELPRHLTGGWTTLDKFAADKPKLVRGALNAIYGAVGYLQDNRDYAIRLIAENNEISAELAAIEYEQTIMSLSRDGASSLELATVALELARISGVKDLSPPAAVFKNVPITPTKP